MGKNPGKPTWSGIWRYHAVTAIKGQGGTGGLATRGYPKNRNSWRGPGWLRLAVSSIVIVWLVLPEPSVRT